MDGVEGLRVRDADLLGPHADVVAVFAVQGLDILVDLASRRREIGHVERREAGRERARERAQTVEEGPVYQDTRVQTRDGCDGPDRDVLGGRDGSLGEDLIDEEAGDEQNHCCCLEEGEAVGIPFSVPEDTEV